MQNKKTIYTIIVLFSLAVVGIFIWNQYYKESNSSFFNEFGGFCGSSSKGFCNTAADCTTGGCSGQICQSTSEEPRVTTCEYKTCYNKGNLQCGCVNNQCQWAK